MLEKFPRILLLAILIFSPLIVYSKSQFTPPNKCPSIHLIQSVGLQEINEVTKGTYYGRNTSYYDTNGEWVFMIGYFHASSMADALAQSKNALIQMSGNPVPMEDTRQGGYQFDWICTYQTHSDLTAAAGQWDLDLTSRTGK